MKKEIRGEIHKGLIDWMVNYYGDKCSVYQKGCVICEAWKIFESAVNLDRLKETK